MLWKFVDEQLQQEHSTLATAGLVLQSSFSLLIMFAELTVCK